VTFATATTQLADRDADLRRVVSRWGPPPFWTHPDGFPGLVLAILGQQVSVESADAAFEKLERRLGQITPEGILSLDGVALKAAGFSRQKAGYVRGLAQAIVDGALDLDAIGQMPDDAVREALIAVKGIGPWTADTYLLFSLRRPDAWPSGDLALAKAVQDLREMAVIPTYPELDVVAGRWQPWRAVAARILWHDYLSRRGRGT
jgi:DNA-3-methyladenine glycosylase II